LLIEWPEGEDQPDHGHHHATLCIAAYGFLISEKATLPPSGPAVARRGPQSADARAADATVRCASRRLSDAVGLASRPSKRWFVGHGNNGGSRSSGRRPIRTRT
jgi:hypothetical protein